MSDDVLTPGDAVPTFDETLAQLSKLERSPIVLADYQVSEEELNNLTYLCMKFVIGWPMRQADFSVVRMMAGQGPFRYDQLKTEYLPHLAEYMWDHLMAEPDDPDVDKVQVGCEYVMEQLFTLPEAVRKDIEAK